MAYILTLLQASKSTKKPSAANEYERLLDEINCQLEEKGVIVKRGAIVDAIVTKNSRTGRVGRRIIWLNSHMVFWRDCTLRGVKQDACPTHHGVHFLQPLPHAGIFIVFGGLIGQG